MKKWWAWVLVALIALLLFIGSAVVTAWLISQSADQQTGNTQPQKDVSPSETPTPPATTEPSAPAALVIPSCEMLNPAAQKLTDQMLAKYPDRDIVHGEQPVDRVSDVLGPAANTALGKATKTRVCAYPFHYEAGLYQLVSELSGAPKDSLVAAVRGDKDFISSTRGPAQIYVWKQTLSDGHWGTAYTTHVFLGDFWVAMYGPTDEFTNSAIDALLAANPQLAN